MKHRIYTYVTQERNAAGRIGFIIEEIIALRLNI